VPFKQSLFYGYLLDNAFVFAPRGGDPLTGYRRMKGIGRNRPIVVILAAIRPSAVNYGSDRQSSQRPQAGQTA
jgi:hypothetical protein